jgi:hypothetical protein
MQALPERAVAAYTEALLAEEMAFLDADQRSSTAQFVLERWKVATQPVQLGTGAAAVLLGAAAWSVSALGGSDSAAGWRTVVGRVSGRALPGLSELSTFVLSLATAYACDRWPEAALRRAADPVAS